ncbi:ankyrin repeat domain-containing protein [Hydrogenophaga sp.]|jgi:ankyrin repeat protein|uniref:ankyrin repeat domain-containing protein n=1 Tax=Hydrogenophaga sp. TaxID=1904254 RepID=UPI0027174138|nr:ankyrin repeat domain-containing protein [Hydrogenophaga sp.]MDO9134677.1 ankyrin repeat domain-containing protein [Hydrogenophaga sp.]MDP2075924.1 ankyrin repeat domain-containing protein [Hydrogenophaga sp.]MDP3109280.1 ankyrin repeat domain-containing protein [Hydrogenophaga sp.]MDP3349700.1 ankyrin repeat domain-containing protein [Hydrogenophaga sp.]MDZ4283268.1 ankyrin repeat domain-containing protein [Hydrogenophaga sp.]
MNTEPDDKQLIAAAETGNLAALQDWLTSQPALLQWRSHDGDTLLHLACWQKQLDLVPWLVNAGADVNAQGWLQRTPLHYAVNEGSERSVLLVRLLLQHGGQPRLRDTLGNTVADWARVEMHGDALRSVLRELGEPLTGVRP